jgi:hypothetical protein
MDHPPPRSALGQFSCTGRVDRTLPAPAQEQQQQQQQQRYLSRCMA